MYKKILVPHAGTPADDDALKYAVSVGTSILPDESGIIIRILGNKTDRIFDVIFKTLEISRKKILGASFSKTRKN